jgi:hypothetical protein
MADITLIFIMILVLGFQHIVDVFKQKAKAYFIDRQDVLWQAYVINDDELPGGQYYFHNNTGIEARERNIPNVE